MKKITLILIFAISATGKCQELRRQMVAIQGTSSILSNGMYLSQSIGQQSVTGTVQKNNLSFSQGFQQSLQLGYRHNQKNLTIQIITYPNPFLDKINFQFSEEIDTPVEITLFDITGKIVFHETAFSKGNLLTVSNLQLPAANYLVHLVTKKLNYYTQIIHSK